MSLLWKLSDALIATLRDVLPIVVIILFFQLVVLRRGIPNFARVAWGFSLVFVGLAVFLMGLEIALFPLGETMANQLTEGTFVASPSPESPVAESPAAESPATESPATESQVAEAPVAEAEAPPWYAYYWTFLFAFAIGASTTVAEPSLIAVALKAESISGGTIRALGLRIAVALGVGIGVMLGTIRIVTAIPLPYFIIAGYVIVVLQTAFAPRSIVPLAYDSGGVTTSTVTVPLVTALGLGLASRVPGANPLLDGFGLIAFASLFPMMSVMGYAQLAALWESKRGKEEAEAEVETT